MGIVFMMSRPRCSMLLLAWCLTGGCIDWESLYAPQVSAPVDTAPQSEDAAAPIEPPAAMTDADPDAGADADPEDAAPDPREPVALWRFDEPGRPGVQIAAIADRAPRLPMLPLHWDLNRDSGKSEVRDGVLVLDGGFLSAGITESDALGEVLVKARSLSLELWVKATPTGNGTIMTTFTPLGDKTAGRAFAIIQRENVIHFSVHTTATDSSGDKFVGPAMAAAEVHAHFPVETNAPIHVIARYSDATKMAEVYVDGVLGDAISHRRPGAPPPTLVWTHEKYEFGLGGAFDLASTWRGSIFKAAIYDRALAPAEIAALYSAGMGPP
jgi:hypothetical protein